MELIQMDDHDQAVRAELGLLLDPTLVLAVSKRAGGAALAVRLHRRPHPRLILGQGNSIWFLNRAGGIKSWNLRGVRLSDGHREIADRMPT